MMKILIVDDQQTWLAYNSKAMYQILGEDIILHTASSAQEGYSKLLESEKEPYDYIITDMQMETDYLPKPAGEWLIEQAKSLPFCCNTKIIIISSLVMIDHIAKNHNVDYIHKSAAIKSFEPYKELIQSY